MHYELASDIVKVTDIESALKVIYRRYWMKISGKERVWIIFSLKIKRVKSAWLIILDDLESWKRSIRTCIKNGIRPPPTTPQGPDWHRKQSQTENFLYSSGS